MGKNINKRNSKIKYCCMCGTELTNENWQSSQRKSGYYVCKNCIRKYRKEYKRKYVIGSTHKAFYKINKRRRPDYCELCSKETKKLNYHHWDDNFPQLGVWVCYQCHIIVEHFEKNLIEDILKKYIDMKIKITKNISKT